MRLSEVIAMLTTTQALHGDVATSYTSVFIMSPTEYDVPEPELILEMNSEGPGTTIARRTDGSLSVREMATRIVNYVNRVPWPIADEIRRVQDIGVPMSYFIVNGWVNPNDEGMELIRDTYRVLKAGWYSNGKHVPAWDGE